MEENLNPDHYKQYDPPPWWVFHAWNLNTFQTSVIKYVLRAGHKKDSPKLQDLYKAKRYLDEWIRLEEHGNPLQGKNYPEDHLSTKSIEGFGLSRGSQDGTWEIPGDDETTLNIATRRR